MRWLHRKRSSNSVAAGVDMAVVVEVEIVVVVEVETVVVVEVEIVVVTEVAEEAALAVVDVAASKTRTESRMSSKARMKTMIFKQGPSSQPRSRSRKLRTWCSTTPTTQRWSERIWPMGEKCTRVLSNPAKSV